MRKICGTVLIILMVVALGACGAKDISDVVLQISENTERSENAAGLESPAASEDADEETPFIAFGIRSGNRYENKFFGIGCELDESWTVASDEELAALQGENANMLIDERVKDNLQKFDTTYDFLATAEDGLKVVNIALQNLGLADNKLYSIDDYISAALAPLNKQLSDMGFTDIKGVKGSVDFAGEKRAALFFTAELEGQACYYMETYVKVDEYIATISIISFFEDSTSSIAEAFFALD